MKNLLVVSLVILLCVSAYVGVPAGRSQAQAPHQPDDHLTYTLQLVTVVDAPAEHMWMVQAPYNQAVNLEGRAFRSLASPILRQWVSHLPEGAIISYTPSSLPLIAKAFGDPEAGVSGFARFCRSKHIQFGFNPVL